MKLSGVLNLVWEQPETVSEVAGRMSAGEAAQQGFELAGAFVLGLLLGVLYDVYRVWFRATTGTIRHTVGDVLWWLLALGISLAVLYRLNGLEVRGFVLLLAVLGCTAQQLLLSPKLFGGMEKLFCLILRWWRGVWRIFHRAVELLLTPVVWAVEIVFRLLRLVVRLCRGVGRTVLGLLSWLLIPLFRPIYKPLRAYFVGLKQKLANVKRRAGEGETGSDFADEGQNEEIVE